MRLYACEPMCTIAIYMNTNNAGATKHVDVEMECKRNAGHVFEYVYIQSRAVCDMPFAVGREVRRCHVIVLYSK